MKGLWVQARVCDGIKESARWGQMLPLRVGPTCHMGLEGLTSRWDQYWIRDATDSGTEAIEAGYPALTLVDHHAGDTAGIPT